MTDAELNEIETDARTEIDAVGALTNDRCLALVSEVKRLRAIEAMAAQQVEMAAHAIARTRAAECLADAVVDRALLMDRWGEHVAHCQACLAECPEDLRFDAEEEALDARIEEATLGHRKARGL